MSSVQRVTRRELFDRLIRPWQRDHEVESPKPSPVAVIQGRHCLAYRSLICSTCAERCPEPGAIVIEHGVPRVVTDRCTGCGDCRAACPAPSNAILMLPPRQKACAI